MAEPLPPPLAALWFDGRSSRPVPVRLCLVHGPGAAAAQGSLQSVSNAPAELQRLALDQLQWPEHGVPASPSAAVMLGLGALGSLQVQEPAALQAWMRYVAPARPLAQRLQAHGLALAVAVLVVGLALVGFYRDLTPWLATRLTRHVPLAWESAVAAQGLAQLDQTYLQPSALPPAEQQRLRRGLDALIRQAPAGLYAGERPVPELVFRRGLGPNALALPGGRVILTDELVALNRQAGLGDDALLGVLAHEWGHVVQRHGTRMLIEHGVLQIGLALALGDVSYLLSSGSALLSGLAYQRWHETEADCLALRLMQAQGRSTAPMAELLLRVSGDAASGASPAPPWGELLGSHPDTVQRARLLRGEGPQRCPA